MKALRARLGGDGVQALVWLWLGVRESSPTGSMAGWSVEDVELEADWLGERGRLVAVLQELRWIDGEPGSSDFRVHDWPEHQGFAFHAPARKAKALHAAHRRHGVKVREGCGVCYPLATSMLPASLALAPSPNPSPVPNPNPVRTPPTGGVGGNGKQNPETAEDAWTLLQRTLKARKSGERLRDLLPAAVWSVVETIGVDEVTEPKQRGVTRAHFLRFYAAARKAAR